MKCTLPPSCHSADCSLCSVVPENAELTGLCFLVNGDSNCSVSTHEWKKGTFVLREVLRVWKWSTFTVQPPGFVFKLKFWLFSGEISCIFLLFWSLLLKRCQVISPSLLVFLQNTGIRHCLFKDLRKLILWLILLNQRYLYFLVCLSVCTVFVPVCPSSLLLIRIFENFLKTFIKNNHLVTDMRNRVCLTACKINDKYVCHIFIRIYLLTCLFPVLEQFHGIYGFQKM